jgi:undecaprenyl diphosphate synthase
MTQHLSSTLAIPEVGSIPRHVAIIMDGNGRWARNRMMPRVAGHSEGLNAVQEDCFKNVAVSALSI